MALTYRAAVHGDAGEFDVASALIEESDAFTDATGDAPLRYAALLLVVRRGEEAQASSLLQTCPPGRN
jgi:hypothetical protein